MKTAQEFTACGSCNRGGNGNDKEKCSCGWQVYEVNALGCFLGSPIEGIMKPRPKLTRSQERFARYRKVADCFESFRDFLRYEAERDNREYTL